MLTQTVTVKGYNSNGEGVARLEDGRVVFIRGAARDDVLEITLIQELSKIARAEITRIITPSPYRIEPDCAVYPKCGGCDYRHITYEEELFAKLQCVNDALKRIGSIPIQVDQILHTGQINGYRNKAVLHSDGSSIGFHKARSHDVIPVEHCLLLKDMLNDAIKSLVKDEIKPNRNITLCSGVSGINISYENPSHRLNREKTCQPLEEEMDGLIFQLEGFFQVNTNAALLLFQKAREYAALSKSETLVDLYCGVGALTLFIGRDAGRALGVEINTNAVKIARENAKRNMLSHIDFINADADDDNWMTDISEPDCIIVDPPRRGLSQGTINKILKLSPKRLVYISCNPATLARDLKLMTMEKSRGLENPAGIKVKDPLKPGNYKLKKICAVDMFPRTANIECCCLLIKES